jgi:hypothetical protein
MAYSQPPRVKARLPDMRLKNKYFLLDFYPDLKHEIHRPPGAASWPEPERQMVSRAPGCHDFARARWGRIGIDAVILNRIPRYPRLPAHGAL